MENIILGRYSATNTIANWSELIASGMCGIIGILNKKELKIENKLKIKNRVKQ